MIQTDTRSLGELFADLGQDVSNLVRQEVQLAKTELSEKALAAGKGAALFAVAGVCAFLAAQALLAAAVVALAMVMPGWAAALAVGLFLLLTGALLAFAGFRKARKATNPVPEKTVETIKEDVQWARRQLT